VGAPIVPGQFVFSDYCTATLQGTVNPGGVAANITITNGDWPVLADNEIYGLLVDYGSSNPENVVVIATATQTSLTLASPGFSFTHSPGAPLLIVILSQFVNNISPYNTLNGVVEFGMDPSGSTFSDTQLQNAFTQAAANAAATGKPTKVWIPDGNFMFSETGTAGSITQGSDGVIFASDTPPGLTLGKSSCVLNFPNLQGYPGIIWGGSTSGSGSFLQGGMVQNLCFNGPTAHGGSSLSPVQYGQTPILFESTSFVHTDFLTVAGFVQGLNYDQSASGGNSSQNTLDHYAFNANAALIIGSGQAAAALNLGTYWSSPGGDTHSMRIGLLYVNHSNVSSAASQYACVAIWFGRCDDITIEFIDIIRPWGTQAQMPLMFFDYTQSSTSQFPSDISIRHFNPDLVNVQNVTITNPVVNKGTPSATNAYPNFFADLSTENNALLKGITGPPNVIAPWIDNSSNITQCTLSGSGTLIYNPNPMPVFVHMTANSATGATCTATVGAPANQISCGTAQAGNSIHFALAARGGFTPSWTNGTPTITTTSYYPPK
jgi:hypothetical protein